MGRRHPSAAARRALSEAAPSAAPPVRGEPGWGGDGVPTRRRGRGARHRAHPGGPAARLLSPVGALIALAVLLIAAGITATVVLVPASGGPSAARSPAPPGAATAGSSSRPAGSATSSAPSIPSSSGTPNGQGPAKALAGWIDEQLPAGAHLTAAPPVAARLRSAGIPADRVSAETGTPAGGGPTFLVTDGPPPAGARVVGRFDDGGSAPLLVVDPSPGTPTPPELELRRSVAAALLANPTTRTSGAAAAVLRSADVDPRLLSILAALAARSGVGIADFPPPPDAPADGLLARRAVVDSMGGQPLQPGSPATANLLTWLRAQLPPYAPDSVTVTGSGVLIGYRYVSDPDGVVAAATH